ncbi:hypothetical protein EGR_03919 [Echinococcus granulosus]|uniref:Uncharacterized protein n=1 Tax=Echinococcus granulosus TaxID=6210 RepID=W6V4V7_ECHGR|nr:hypothetical protein EGR_03919 [Echinococcus granulosus]EUB61244.1 hypothetical protein EGR_03919 [Echinococcus granulosus]
MILEGYCHAPFGPGGLRAALLSNIMLTSSVSCNGLPPDLEFTLDEISTELVKLGVKETSPTRLAAIKADLDTLIARDLDTFSISLDKEKSATSRSRSNSTSFSSDGAATTTSDSEAKTYCRSPQLMEGEEDKGNEETYDPEETSGESNTISSDFGETACSGSRSHSCSGNSRLLWRFNHQSKIPAPCDVPPMGRRIYGTRASLRSSSLENLDYDRNLSSSSSVSTRRPLTAGRTSRRAGGGVNRGDPVSLWRLYNSQWERQARATAVSERALRWSVKAAMAVREVPLLAASRRSLHFGPSSESAQGGQVRRLGEEMASLEVEREEHTRHLPREFDLLEDLRMEAVGKKSM